MNFSIEKECFRDKSVLITGGTGTFGRNFAKNLLEEDLVSKVIIFSRDEWKQWEMRESHPIFSNKKIRYFLGDVRDEERMKRAFNEVNFVVHTAALKQVPAAEYNPSEFVKTNIQGSMNLINAAIESGVEKVVALSTDKAVNPLNLYGATKLCAEKVFIAAKSYVGKTEHPCFSIVRYGNVLGSRGSLIPLWEKLIENGDKMIPITDERMTRFWITIDEAINFVKKAFCRMQGGEIFIPKSPSVKIVNLAAAFISMYAQGATHKIIGIRPGEKIHELLISNEESFYALEMKDAYVLVPHQEITSYINRFPYDLRQECKKVEEGFYLASNTNPLFTDSKDEIKKLLVGLHKNYNR